MNTETKTKWTAGLWEVSGESIVTTNGKHCIAVIESDGGYEAPAKQRKANAQLIALAPELAEALRAVVECPDYRGIKTHEMEAARALLAKLPK